MDGFQHTYQYILILIGELELKVSRGHQHGFDGPHAVIVVELGGRAALNRACRSSRSSPKEAWHSGSRRSTEENLCYQGVVRDHHGHCSEQHLCKK